MDRYSPKDYGDEKEKVVVTKDGDYKEKDEEKIQEE